MKKKLKCRIEYSSIIPNPKWVVGVTICNFNNSDKRKEDNADFLRKLMRLVSRYDGLYMERLKENKFCKDTCLYCTS